MQNLEPVALYLILVFGLLSSTLSQTVNEARYVTPSCLQEVVSTALSGNPPGQTVGIPIVFKYVDQSDTRSHTTLRTFSQSKNTLKPNTCSDEMCKGLVATTSHQSARQKISTFSLQENTKEPSSSFSDAPKITSMPLHTAIPSELQKSSTFDSKPSHSSISAATELKKSSVRKATASRLHSQKNSLDTKKNREDRTKTIFVWSTFTPSTSTVTQNESVVTTLPQPLITELVVSQSRNFTITQQTKGNGITVTQSSLTPSYLFNNFLAPFSKLNLKNNTSIPSHTATPFPKLSSNMTYKTGNYSFSTTSKPRVQSSNVPIYKNVTALTYMRDSSSPSSLFGNVSKQTNRPVSHNSAHFASSTALPLSKSSALVSYSKNLSSTSAAPISSSTMALQGNLGSSSSSLNSHKDFSTTSTGRSLSSIASEKSASSSNAATVSSNSLFKPIAVDDPPSLFSREKLPLSIPSGISNDGPYQTNKFYSNLFLDDQTYMIWSYPYGLFWKKEDYYGFAVQHTDITKRVFESQDNNHQGTDSYYENPLLNGEIIFSADEINENANHLHVSEMKSMSLLVKISGSNPDSDYIEIPIVQGMGFVTAIYRGNLKPKLDTTMGINKLTKEDSSSLGSSTQKYRASLNNGCSWLIYVTSPNDSSEVEFTTNNPYSIEGSKSVNEVIIQVAVDPEEKNLEKHYDEAVGIYPIKADVQGSVNGNSAEYKFVYSTNGTSNSGKTLVFALPHHLESLTQSTKNSETGIVLPSTTKGNMSAFLTNELVMSETLETDLQFLPWTPNMKKSLSYSSDQLDLLSKTANDELSVDIKGTVSSAKSNYFSGKLLDKYSYILLVVSDIIKDDTSTKEILSKMKDAFKTFTSNKQYYPLIYDTKFGGVTSSSAQNGDTMADYGAAYYNDHHFHYGYFVHAAAVVGYVDKKNNGTWIEENKDWVNALIRDVANPSEDDKYFPVSRMFDWYAGHSWAAGLFGSGDGKNEESTSEDYNFSYGMKLWGKVIGDSSMESRADLMLAVMKRAMNKYFYYKSDNSVEPRQILPNKVSGIFYENKVDYTTFFGTPLDHPEYVHGIHMLPVTPASGLIRDPSFVKEEWDSQISAFIDNVDSGWSGVLLLNKAIIDPKSSYQFFSSENFNSHNLDNGQSRTWCLAYSGGLANAS